MQKHRIYIALGLTLGLCALFFLVQDRVAPTANQTAQAIKDRLQGKTPRTYGMTLGGRWAFGTAGRLYHYGLYDPDHQSFQGLTVLTVDRQSPRITSQLFAAYSYVRDVRNLASVIGEEELTPLDHQYLEFGEAFERQFTSQRFDETSYRR
jgi:lipopolysaccharide export LptBFGC system permease protein LptF